MMNKKSFRILILFLVMTLSLPPALAEEMIRYRNMDLCSSKVSELDGYFGEVCRELLESDDFRKVCENVPEGDLIRCDGSEPDALYKRNLSDFQNCLPMVWEGTKDTVVEVAELGWSAVKATGRGLVWLFWGEEEEVADEVGAEESSDEATSQVEAPVSGSLGDIGAAMRVTDDASAYAAHTALDEEEGPGMMEIMATKEFWNAFSEEVSAWLNEELKELSCLSSKAQTELLCYIVGAFIPGGALKAGKLIKLGKQGAPALRKLFNEVGGDRLKEMKSKFGRGKPGDPTS